MKTNVLLTALLAVTIQVMVKGQTPVNQAINNYELFFAGNIQKLSLPTDEQNEIMKAEKSDEILQQANDLIERAKDLREEAARLEQQAVVKKIIASEINGRLHNKQFILNKQQADSLIQNSTLSSKEQINTLITTAGRDIKIAKEMREEAYAWTNNAARLGTLSNAEEKETSSLTKITDALTQLKSIKRYNGSTPTRSIPVNLNSLQKTIN